MWTLAEFSKIEQDPLRKSIVDTLLMETNTLELVPFETIGTLSTGIVRVQDLPSVGFRRINAAYDKTDIGHFEHAYETIALFGRDIDTDEAIARAKNSIADARAVQQMLSLKSMAYTFNDKLINGNIDLADPLEYNGLKKRIDDIYAEGFTGQKIDAACSGKGILNDTAAQDAFLDKLDELIYSIKGHQPEYLLMNSKMLLALRSCLRRRQLLDQTRDMFDRRVDMYQGCRLVDLGVKADQTTQIITSTETSAGLEGSDEHTSIYAMKLSVGDMTWGIQEFPMEAKDLTPGNVTLQEKPAFRTRITWNLGLCTVDPRSLSRLYGIIPDASS